MNIYKENNCHFCKKIFCCKKCRENHETLVHKVFIDCNICFYGNTLLRDPPECLIKHIQNQHWPLHCIKCKGFFGSMDELLKWNKCPAVYQIEDFEKRCYIPCQFGGESIYHHQSPYLVKCLRFTAHNCVFSSLATSTPLQGEINNFSEKSNEEIITPVDFLNISNDKKYFNALKRKVTFCETPTTEDVNLKHNDMTTYILKTEKRIIITPSSGHSPDTFYSANQNLHDITHDRVGKSQVSAIDSDSENVNKINVEVEENKDEEKNSQIGQKENNTLWISAVNISPKNYLEQSTPIVNINNYSTPVAAKLKKKQINIASPTTVRKDIELKLPEDTDLNVSLEEYASVYSKIQNTNNDESQKFVEKFKAFSSTTNDPNEIWSETFINGPGRFLTSVGKLVKNVTSVVQEISGISHHSKTSLKRSTLEYDSFDGPSIKRYKLTEIKCRRPIRKLAGREYSEYVGNAKNDTNNIIYEIKRTFADKAIQTDE